MNYFSGQRSDLLCDLSVSKRMICLIYVINDVVASWCKRDGCGFDPHGGVGTGTVIGVTHH